MEDRLRVWPLRVPAAIVGTLSTDLFPAPVLKAIFAVGIIVIGTQLYLSYRQEQREKIDGEIEQDAAEPFESELTTRDGEIYRCTVCEKNQGCGFAAIGPCCKRFWGSFCSQSQGS